MSKGGGGKGTGKGEMLENDYFIMKNSKQKKKFLPPKAKKKTAMRYSGKIEMHYKKA
jgi:hypothetical protein